VELVCGEGFFGCFALGDVAGDLGDADDVAVGVDDGGEAEGDEDLLSVLVFTGDLGVVDAVAAAEGFEEVLEAFFFPGPGQEGDGLAEDFLYVIAKYTGCGCVGRRGRCRRWRRRRIRRWRLASLRRRRGF
jgi:hypothetical protein